MNIFKITLRLLRSGLIWLLIAYWVAFIGYTVKNLVADGPSAVVVWYRHIDGELFQWSWGVFLARQFAILAITLALWLYKRAD